MQSAPRQCRTAAPLERLREGAVFVYVQVLEVVVGAVHACLLVARAPDETIENCGGERGRVYRLVDLHVEITNTCQLLLLLDLQADTLSGRDRSSSGGSPRRDHQHVSISALSSPSALSASLRLIHAPQHLLLRHHHRLKCEVLVCVMFSFCCLCCVQF